MKKPTTPIASKHINNNWAIVIYAIEHGIDDYIYHATIINGKRSKMCRSKLHYTVSGNDYFIRYGRREKLNEYIRH